MYSAPCGLTWCSPCANPSSAADLVEHVVAHVVGADVHHAAPEPEQVGEPGMGADVHAVGARLLDRPPHRPRIAGVEAARDVGRRDHAHQRLVGPALPQAEALAEVGVEVDHAIAFSSARRV